MKQALFCIALACVTPFLSFSQSTSSTPRISYSPIAQELTTRTIKLNSTGRSTFGGQSRNYIRVDLPPNTVEWYYSFSTSNSDNFGEKLKLAGQISTLLLAVSTGGTSTVFTGLTGAAVQSLYTPPGKMPINSYVFLPQNIDMFLNNKGNYPCPGTEMKSTLTGKMRIQNWNTGTFFIGLENTSVMYSANLQIDVVAIVMKLTTSE